MYRVPLLQPHLTGTQGVEHEDHWNNVIGLGDGHDHMLRIRDWKEQAEEALQQTRSEAFSSIAIYAEVKLKETEQAVLAEATNESIPHRLSTAVACQLLHDMSDALASSFQPIYGQILQQIVKAVYSDYSVSNKGELTFDRIPYFEVADRLRTENSEFCTTISDLKNQLHHCKLNSEECLKRTNIASAEAKSYANQISALRERHQHTLDEKDKAVREADAVKSELVRLRAEHIKMKDSISALNSTSATTGISKNDGSSSDRQEREINEGTNCNVIETQNAGEIFTSATTDIASQTLTNAEKMHCSQHTQTDSINDAVRLQSHTYACMVSVKRVLKAYLASDRKPTTLQFTAVKTSGNRVHVQGLGCSVAIPRILRCKSLVCVSLLSLSETQDWIKSVLMRKTNYEAEHGPIQISTYLFEYYLEMSKSLEEGIRTAYRDLYACQEHAMCCPTIHCFWMSVQGIVTEAASRQLERYTEDLDNLLIAFRSAGNVENVGSWTRQLQECLQLFSPEKHFDDIGRTLAAVSDRQYALNEIDGTILDIRNAMRTRYVENCAQCFQVLNEELSNKAVEAEEHSAPVISFEDFKSTILTQYLERPEEIVYILTEQCRTTFSAVVTCVPLPFISEVIRRRAALTIPGIQRIEEGIAYCQMLSVENTMGKESTKTLPDLV